MKPEPRPRVLVIGPLPPPYHGGSIATRYLLSSSLEREFELIHVDTTDRRGLENIGRLDAGNVGFALLHFARFLRVLVRRQPELVYVPIAQNRLGFLRDCLFLIPALAAGKPLVVHVHGGGTAHFIANTDPLTRTLARRTLRRATRVIVLGDDLRATMRPLIADERLAVVPNGIHDAVGPHERNGASAGRRPEPAAGSVTVLYLGSLMEAKGFLDVIEAVRQVAADGYDVRLVLGGEYFRPSDREKSAVASRGLEDRVRFAGVVDGEEKVALLREADIFAFPTRLNEAHPYVVLEAMAAGLEQAKAGNQTQDIANAFFAVLRRHGIEKSNRTGYPIGVSYPPDWGERTSSLRPGDETVLEAGMTFHFMSGLWMADWGLEITESIVIGDEGPELGIRFGAG
jgi:glycosyltransferase involved in cell wall biosynthesis